jgi:hypothetical protein
VGSCRGNTSSRGSEGANEGEEEREAREGVRGLITVPIRRIPVAEIQSSGERFARPGGVSGTGGKGEKERRCGASYRRATGKKRQAINRELRRENLQEETVSGVRFGWRKETLTWPDAWDPRVSEREGERLYRFGLG